jgi:hypothetical protein
MKALRDLFKRSNSDMPATASSTEPKCTYCGGTEFYGGPSGGMSQNVLCANEKCRHWFNATPFGIEDLKRVEPTEEEKTKAETERRAASDAQRLGWYQEGRAMFEGGKSARDCVKTTANYTAPLSHSDVQRLCGFLDAMKDER